MISAAGAKRRKTPARACEIPRVHIRVRRCGKLWEPPKATWGHLRRGKSAAHGGREGRRRFRRRSATLEKSAPRRLFQVKCRKRRSRPGLAAENQQPAKRREQSFPEQRRPAQAGIVVRGFAQTGERRFGDNRFNARIRSGALQAQQGAIGSPNVKVLAASANMDERSVCFAN
jgi:hypothetical protein